jgi:hypothetical protein
VKGLLYPWQCSHSKSGRSYLQVGREKVFDKGQEVDVRRPNLGMRLRTRFRKRSMSGDEMVLPKPFSMSFAQRHPSEVLPIGLGDIGHARGSYIANVHASNTVMTASISCE